MQGITGASEVRDDEPAVGNAAQPPPHLVLIGLPGAGKTTIGRALARRLRRRFVDLDAEIERAFGKPVSRIFMEDGEAAFRACEAEISAQLASATEPAVIAPGGGWVANEPARAHLRGTARIIYLRVSPDEAVRRMGRGVARRPLLASGDATLALGALHERRRQAYEELAYWTVDTVGLPRGEVVARVLGLLSAHERIDRDDE